MEIEDKEKIMVADLKDIKEIFDKANITFWLDWGTLLGAVRDKKIIPWDKDMDLGVFDSDYNKIISIIPELKKKGFIVNELFVPVPSRRSSYRKFGLSRSKYCTDVYLYCIEKNNAISILFAPDKGSFYVRLIWLMWCLMVSKEVNADPKRKLFFIPKTFVFSFIKSFLSLFPRDYLIKKLNRLLIKIIEKDNGAVLHQVVNTPKYYFDNFNIIEFYGMRFNIPVDAENYLEYKYGESWRIPDKKWDYRNDGAVKLI